MTTDAIIEAAERLFGQQGVDGVSLREIGRAAGSSNHYAVQYHFGSKDALVRAIVARRLPNMERKRGELLSQASRDGLLNDVRALLDVLLRPVVDETDAHGDCSYAAFLINIYWRTSIPRTWLDEAPLTNHVIQLIMSAVPDVPGPYVGERLRLAVVMFLHMLVHLDRAKNDGVTPAQRIAKIDDAIAMAAGAISSPLPSSVSDLLAQPAAPKTILP
ncbi:MAG: helix-turn-helix domain-containing protein [Sphingobium sp.]